MISQVFGGMENLSFVGDMARFLRHKKLEINAKYQTTYIVSFG